MKISCLAQNLADSPTLRLNARAQQLKAEGKPLIHLAAGEPDFPIPFEASRAVLSKLASGRVRYTPVGGTKEAKEAVIAYTAKHYGKTVKPQEVLISSGAKQSLYNFLVAAVDPGDEVIFPAPYWVSYPAMVKLCGGVPVAVSPAEGFQPRVEDMASAISPKTRAVILNSPNNPSGEIYSEDFVREISGICSKRGIWLVMDDIYHQLYFGQKPPVSCYEVSPEHSHLVVINGVSKLYAMTGFRIGWAVADSALISAMAKIQAQTTSCPSELSQAATVGALMGDQDCVSALRKTLEENKTALFAELSGMKKIRLAEPKGTFYCFPDFSAYEPDSAKLCAFLLNEALVAAMPGKDFGMEGHVRLSYCGAKKDIIEGARRIFSILK